MTTGNKTYDFRIPRTDPIGNVTKCGRLVTKSWSGANSTPSKVSGEPRRESVPLLEYRNDFRLIYNKKRKKWIKVWLNKPDRAAVEQRRAILARNRQRDLDSKKRKKIKLVRRPNAYTKTIVDSTSSGFILYRKTGGFMSTGVGSVYGWTDAPCAYDVTQEYKLIAKLRRKVYGSGFHPGIFLAEMPKALTMIASTAVRVRQALLHAALMDWRGIVRNLFPNASNTGPAGFTRKGDPLYNEYRAYLRFKEGRIGLSEFWLELQYGWRPLLGDMESGAAYVAEALSGGATSYSNRVKGVREWVQVENSPQKRNIYWARKYTKFKLVYTITDMSASPPGVPSLAATAGVAWELLPYSFVCDWVVPISSYLDALRTASDLRGKVVRSLLSQTVYFDLTYNTAALVDFRIPGAPMLDCGNSLELVKFDRTVSQEINPPVPAGDMSLSSVFKVWERAVNAVALLKDLRFNEGDRIGLKKLLLTKGAKNSLASY